MNSMTSCTITREGVPIGRVELPADGERVAAAVSPLPAYEAIRSLVRAASVALSTVVAGEPTAAAADQALMQTALRRAAELGRSLELRDAAGALVPTDFIDLTEWPGGHPEVAAIVGLRDSHAGVRASVRQPIRRDADAVRPAPSRGVDADPA